MTFAFHLAAMDFKKDEIARGGEAFDVCLFEILIRHFSWLSARVTGQEDGQTSDQIYAALTCNCDIL